MIKAMIKKDEKQCLKKQRIEGWLFLSRYENKKEYIYICTYIRIVHASILDWKLGYTLFKLIWILFFVTLTEIKSSREKKLAIRDYTEPLILETNPRGLKIKKKRRKEREKEKDSMTGGL